MKKNTFDANLQVTETSKFNQAELNSAINRLEDLKEVTGVPAFKTIVVRFPDKKKADIELVHSNFIIAVQGLFLFIKENKDIINGIFGISWYEFRKWAQLFSVLKALLKLIKEVINSVNN